MQDGLRLVPGYAQAAAAPPLAGPSRTAHSSAASAVVGWARDAMANRRHPSQADPDRGRITDIEAARRRRTARAAADSGSLSRQESLDETLNTARAARVEDLRRRVDAGAYRPDPEEIARRLMDQGF